MKKLLITGLLVVSCGLYLTGCKKKEEPIATTEQPIVEAVVVETETEAEPTRPSGVNLLTGEPMDEKLAAQRPVAIMIGNTVDALPQYGLGQADILYEVPVEGGLTRLMGIYQDYSNLDKIGSVRSCRHYFAYYAIEFDAIYLHYGQASYAEALLGSGLVDDLNGLDTKVDSLAFTRDPNRKAPHNAFSTSEGIAAAIEYKEYETQYDENFMGHYLFAEEGKETELKTGEKAVVVRPGYVLDKPWFVYNEEDGLYYRFQYKMEHMDENTNEQLAFKNIIFQYSNYHKLDENYLDVYSSGGGEGKYITNGKAIDITWERKDENSITHYYDANGDELVLNQGKTCVCVVLNDAVKRVAIYATEAEFDEAQAAN